MLFAPVTEPTNNLYISTTVTMDLGVPVIRNHARVTMVAPYYSVLQSTPEVIICQPTHPPSESQIYNPQSVIRGGYVTCVKFRFLQSGMLFVEDY